MKKIIQIAKLELSLLFYSPIAWLLILVLFMQMALANLSAIEDLQYLLGLKVDLSGLTDKLFTTSISMGTLPVGIFFAILGSLYLYTPLITMGIISRELNSGTIKLLYSSPVKLSQIVYGKFLAMVVYNLVVVTLMSLFVVLGALFVVHFDYAHVLVALLASFLLLCTYSAIGIFMSSLTTYQVIAAIGTFAVLALMNYIGQFGQGLDFVRDLTYSLSMPSRAERLVGGLLTSRDVIYYLVVTGIFLGFTIARLQFARVSKSIVRQVLRYVIILIAGLAIAYISSRQHLIVYYDATYTKENTITKNTQEILKAMGDAPIEMTEYINVMDNTYDRGAPVNRIFGIARWEPYLRFKSNIKLNWVYYNGSFDQQAFKERAKQLEVDTADFLSPEATRKQVDLSGESGRLVIQLKYKGRTTWLRTFEDADFWAKEAEIAAALKRLTCTPPKIVFSTDGYQRSVDKVGDRDYKLFFNVKTSRSALINQGFDIDSVSIENSEIPKGIATLVISDPKVTFSKVALTRLQKYIAEGGNLFIAGEPGKQSVLNPILGMLGVKMLEGSVVQRSKDYSYDLVTPKLTPGALVMDPGLTDIYQHKGVVTMPGVSALSDEKEGVFTIHPLLMTDMRRSWIKQGSFVLDSAALVFDARVGDQQGAFPTVLKLTRKLNHREQRIIVSGDADFFSNKEGWRNMVKVNNPFTLSVFKWFSYGEFPVQMIKTDPIDNTLKLNGTGVEILQILYYGVIPGAILLLGIVLLTRRKRK
ncbi:Gldg family protein [Pedobacter cryoconitis]|uniref:ABC-2 type transport system permease protein n=1 Tax=Pedobacter cryoconitis TaxID=188932 RepID=A0A7X0MHE1_9SPHI|nr:Gldg family protein [Pedobacter cryoconitis]MBB6498751.1 ABC-2 type transport system permease protein [Pedobacter cryoconitis]